MASDRLENTVGLSLLRTTERYVAIDLSVLGVKAVKVSA